VGSLIKESYIRARVLALGEGEGGGSGAGHRRWCFSQETAGGYKGRRKEKRKKRGPGSRSVKVAGGVEDLQINRGEKGVPTF